MPRTALVFFREANGSVPIRTFLADVKQTNDELYAKCWRRLEDLRHHGRDLSAQHVKHLGGSIWELRVILGNLHVRFLFAYVGQEVVLLTQGFHKEGAVPQAEIDLCTRRLNLWKQNPDMHEA
jgi:phage-related protein